MQSNDKIWVGSLRVSPAQGAHPSMIYSELNTALTEQR